MSTSHPTRTFSSASRTYIHGSRPLFSSVCPPDILRTSGVQARLKSGVTKDWKGSSGEKHATHRVQKEKDETDPQTIGSSRSMKDREQSFGEANSGESHAATETGGRENEKKAKKEHPKAPEPIIGMNDERAQVKLTALLQKGV
ncbi:hypothetical protein BDW62DRAFT_213777 [Aspergillus aurantiobrunneus]